MVYFRIFPYHSIFYLDISGGYHGLLLSCQIGDKSKKLPRLCLYPRLCADWII